MKVKKGKVKHYKVFVSNIECPCCGVTHEVAIAITPLGAEVLWRNEEQEKLKHIT